MLTRIGILIALVFSVPAQAESVDINIHQSSVTINALHSSSQKVCLEIVLNESAKADDYLANVEILAGPGLDPSNTQLPYLYRLVPEQASSTLIRFRGLQLSDRNNRVEIRAKGGRTLAEVTETHLNLKKPMILKVNENCL